MLDKGMCESICSAKQVAAQVRFLGDAAHSSGHWQSIKEIQEHLLQDAIQICPSLTPSLWERLESVCGRLRLPISAVSAFVYSCPAVQADCLADGSLCVVRFS